MTDSVRRGLGKHSISHCMAQESVCRGFRYASRRGNLLVSRGSVDGYGLGQLVGVDSAEGKGVNPLNMISIVGDHGHGLTKCIHKT